MTIKITLFLISFSLYFTINGFFFSDDTMHKVYKDKGEYDIIDQIPQIVFTTLISSAINIILRALSLSEKSIIEIKQSLEIKRTLDKAKSIESCLKVKLIIYFTFGFLIMAFFWYFISCFCAVYINTQIILINDTLMSFALSMIYPFAINFLPGIFRIPALRTKFKNKECLYKFSTILALI